MILQEYLDYVKDKKPLRWESEEYRFMLDTGNEAMKIIFELNSSYHEPEDVRRLFSQLIGKNVDESFWMFPPFYTDFGKNITIGTNVFINSCCHFQDQGGITLGDGCQIGHCVIFATLNHGLTLDDRSTVYPAPIVLGKNVWVGSNVTILSGVSIGDNAVLGAGTVVTKDVPANAVIEGTPARVIRYINPSEV